MAVRHCIQAHFLLCGLVTVATGAFESGIACVDEYVHCASLEHLCTDEGSAGKNMMKFCKSTCNNCPKGKCSENNGGCGQNCLQEGENSKCSCRRGFQLNRDNKTCEDIDECANETNACPGVERKFCKNTIGSYACETCAHKDGYTMYYKGNTCCKVHEGSCGYDRTMASPVEMESKFARIFGGLTSDDDKWPWMVQLVEQSNSGEVRRYCGGSLVSRRWVLTAAHCFRNYDTLGQWRAILGTNQNYSSMTRLSGRVQVRRIAQLIEHEGSNKINFDHDIALTKLDEDVEFNDAIRPICLPCVEKPEEGDACWAVGFGKTGAKGTNTLQEVDLPIISTARCVKMYNKDSVKFRLEHMICAGSEKGKDACFGDSGGPLMCQRRDSCQWYQAGITSFGMNGCGLMGVPGVYTSVAEHQDWIMSHIGEEDSSGVCRQKSCDDLTDKSTRCLEIIDFCSSYPDYMGKNCALTCCKQRFGIRSKFCEDDATYEAFCEKNIRYCESQLFLRFMSKYCKKTCKFCSF